MKNVKLPNGTTTTNASGTYTVTGNGTYTFIGYDNAGNSKTITESVTNIDKNSPIPTISHTPTAWVIDYVNIHWKFSEPQGESGVKNVKLPNGTTTTNTSGTYTVGDNGNYTFVATDNAGNVKTVTYNISNIDKIKPEGVLSLSYTSLTDKTIQILWEAYDSQSGFSKIILPDATVSNQATGRFNVSQMGTYTFVVYDKVGNDRELSIEVNNVDLEKPILNIKQNITRWINEDLTLSWEAYDNQSGLKEIVLPNGERKTTRNGTHKVSQNGIYTFLAYDKIGNGTMVKYKVTNIDKTAPLLKLKSQPDENGKVKIIWETQDTQSGVRNVILPDGKYSSETTGEFIAKQNGIYRFTSYDKVGNYIVMEIEVDNIDNQGIIFSLWKEKIDGEHYQIGWEILEGQEDFKHILLPNNTYSKETRGYFEAKQEGTYTFLAYDNAGNETKGSIAINQKRLGE